jgi:hypothetical protein
MAASVHVWKEASRQHLLVSSLQWQKMLGAVGVLSALGYKTKEDAHRH